MMLLDLAVLFFVLLGSKILLGAVAVYMLLPEDPQCVVCDAAMPPIRAHRVVQPVMRLLRLERRWCMHCHRETLARRGVSQPSLRRTLRPVSKTRVR